jgi:hypothetical protein
MRHRGKFVAIAIALAALLAIGAYFASPYVAIVGLANALRAGDKDGLEERVDFPAVREHLKAEITASFVSKFQSDPELQSNPFAGLGLALVPMMADKAVDALVTPEGLTRLLASENEADRGPVLGLPKDAGYMTLDRFRVSAPAGQDKSSKINLILRRKGLFHWTLTRIELPKDVLDAEGGATRSDAPAAEAPQPPEQQFAQDGGVDVPVAPTVAASAAGSEAAPPPVAALIRRWQTQDALCRSASGDDPSAALACDDREALAGKIDELGWCYGENPARQTMWARCNGR